MGLLVNNKYCSSLLFFRAVVQIEVEDEQLGFFCAVPAAGGTNQTSVGRSDPPHHASCSSALQRHHVSDPGARLQVPKFHRTVVRTGQNQSSAELETRHRRLVLIGTLQGVQTLSALDVPHSDRGVGVPRNQDVFPELHPTGEGLVTSEGVHTATGLCVPDSDGGVQRAADHERTVKQVYRRTATTPPGIRSLGPSRFSPAASGRLRGGSYWESPSRVVIPSVQRVL